MFYQQLFAGFLHFTAVHKLPSASEISQFSDWAGGQLRPNFGDKVSLTGLTEMINYSYTVAIQKQLTNEVKFAVNLPRELRVQNCNGQRTPNNTHYKLSFGGLSDISLLYRPRITATPRYTVIAAALSLFDFHINCERVISLLLCESCTDRRTMLRRQY